MRGDTPRWLSEVDEWQIQEWRAIGWSAVLRKLARALASCGSGDVKGPTAVAGRLVISCCFHEERTPSLSLYPDGGFTCYGCGMCGGIPEFVTELLQLSSPEELTQFFDDLVADTHWSSGQLRLFA